MTAKIIVHGGASRDLEGGHFSKHDMLESLQNVANQAFKVLQEHGARAAVLEAIRLLEDDVQFNAGTGSRLQADGEIRMSAGLMDSQSGVFSGVVNLQKVRHPIDVAAELSFDRHSILSGSAANLFAKEKGFETYDPLTPHRLQEYKNKKQGRTGTVGAIAIDDDGVLCAANSTGGVGGERPGRVSDSPTIAGTYCLKEAAVACTGIGEQITRDALAAKTVIRVKDGLSLKEAVEKAFQEGNELDREYGLIALDEKGNVEQGATKGTTLLWAVCSSL